MTSRFALLLAAYVISSTAGLLFMRAALKRADANLVSLQVLTNGRLVLGALLYAASFILWMLALARFELTTAYPFFIGVGYTSVTICAVAFLGEPMTLAKGLGAMLVGLGLLLVASGGGA